MAETETATEPRTALSRARVLETAVAFADRHGLEALSMRKLADELGAGAMALEPDWKTAERPRDA